jgi:hypothetical protein
MTLLAFSTRTSEICLSWSLLNHSSIPRSRTIRCFLPLKGSLIPLRLHFLNFISRMCAQSPSHLGNSSVESLTIIKPRVHTALCFPEICSPPLGPIWPTNISFSKLKESVQALGCAYKSCVSILDAIELQVHNLFVAIIKYPERFLIPSSSIPVPCRRHLSKTDI